MPIRMVPLSAAVLFFAGLLSAEVALGQPGRGPANVVVAPARKSEIAVRVDFVGTVMPTRTSVVGSPVDGRVLSYPLNEGDRVNRGDTLAQLRTRRLEIMRNGAQATAEALNQELLQLQRGARKQEIAESEARMHAAEALYEYTKSNIKRIRLAEARGGATADELADAVMRNRQAERLFVAARSAHELVEEGPREEEIAKAQASLLAQQEEVARLEDEIARHTIVAPFDGYISAEHTEIGEWVRQGDPVAEVIEVDEVDVQVVVFEKYINAVRIGAPAIVRVAGLDGRTLEGRVSSIIPQADLQSRSFPVKIRLRNEITEHGPLLKSGMFANVQLGVGGRGSEVLVPKDALVLGGQSPMVYVVDPSSDGGGGNARPVPVQTGLESDGHVMVTGEVREGDLVVIRGNERLQQGGSVVIAERREQ